MSSQNNASHLSDTPNSPLVFEPTQEAVGDAIQAMYIAVVFLVGGFFMILPIFFLAPSLLLLLLLLISVAVQQFGIARSLQSLQLVLTEDQIHIRHRRFPLSIAAEEISRAKWLAEEFALKLKIGRKKRVLYFRHFQEQERWSMVSRLHDLIPAEKQLSWQSFLTERKRDMLPHAMFSEQEVEWKEPPKNLPSPENSDNPWQPTTFPHSPD